MLSGIHNFPLGIIFYGARKRNSQFNSGSRRHPPPPPRSLTLHLPPACWLGPSCESIYYTYTQMPALIFAYLFIFSNGSLIEFRRVLCCCDDTKLAGCPLSSWAVRGGRRRRIFFVLFLMSSMNFKITHAILNERVRVVVCAGGWWWRVIFILPSRTFCSPPPPRPSSSQLLANVDDDQEKIAQTLYCGRQWIYWKSFTRW